MLPHWLRALLDETFLWVAAGQLLLALGVRPASVRRLSEVQGLLQDARRVLGDADHRIPRLEDVRTVEDLDRFGERMEELAGRRPTSEELEIMMPAPVAVMRLQGSASIVLDLHGGATLETRPVVPRGGEVRRLVGVIRAIPRPTLDRLLPLRLLSSRLVLTVAITRALEALRQDWSPPGGARAGLHPSSRRSSNRPDCAAGRGIAITPSRRTMRRTPSLGPDARCPCRRRRCGS